MPWLDGSSRQKKSSLQITLPRNEAKSFACQDFGSRTEVLLLDEPAANLDPKARIDLRNLPRKLASEGKTILVSSHLLSELQDLYDTIGIMKEGTMIHSGTIDEIAENESGQDRASTPHRTV